jgi:putative ABC transport system permease protein
VSARRPGRTPPRLVTRVLRGLLGEGPDARSIIGDLHEEYQAIACDRGRVRAALWYWRQALGTGLSYARPGRAALDRLRQDLGFAMRGLRREPGFAAAVIATLALAIGAGTAIFSVVDGVLLRPLPFDAPHELVRVWASNERTGDPYVDLMYSDIEPFRRAGSAFASISGLSVAPRVMMDERGQNREDILVGRSTSDLFETLGVEPVLGRLYTVDDARTGTQLVVISHELWQRRFSGAADVIGRFVHLDVRGFEIIGVLPPRMGYPESVHAWRALTAEEMEDDDREVHLVARLAEGARPSAAQAEVASVAASLADATPETHADLGAWLQPLQAMVVRDVEAALWALLGAVGVLLLIACLNTANLLLARAARSGHEVAIRTALGASRPRIVAMRLTESLVLAGLGGVAGLALGRWVLSFMLGLSPELPRVETVELDLRVVGVMTAVTALAGILFGVAPALHAASTPPQRTLREDTPRATHGGRRLRLQAGLVTTELALSTVLVVVAVLLGSTFRTAVTYDRGFEFDNLVAITVDPMHPPEEGDATRAYFASILERVRRLGGVREAAVSSHPVLEPRGFRVPVAVEGAPVVTPTPMAYVNIVSHGLFATAGIALVEGRGVFVRGRRRRRCRARRQRALRAAPSGRLRSKVGSPDAARLDNGPRRRGCGRRRNRSG